MEPNQSLLKQPLRRKQNAEVAEIVSGRAGEKGIAECIEEREAVESGDGSMRIEVAAAGPTGGGGIGEGSGRGARSVCTVAAGREADHRLAGEMLFEEQSAGERELLIAAACARRAVHADCDLAAREQAEFAAGMLRSMRDEALDQIGCGAVVRPIVTTVVYEDFVAE
jgi:hypothetical protein